MVERNGDGVNVASSTDRRRFLAAVGALGATGLAGCGGDDDTDAATDTDTPTDTDAGGSGNGNGKRATSTDTDDSTPTATPEPETFYSVFSQQDWEIVRGTTEGVTIEDGVLSVGNDGEAGRFESIQLSGVQPADSPLDR
jgi:hypothetical protein